MISSGSQGFKIVPEESGGPGNSLYAAGQMARPARQKYGGMSSEMIKELCIQIRHKYGHKDLLRASRYLVNLLERPTVVVG
jgi:hypothetical protein